MEKIKTEFIRTQTIYTEYISEEDFGLKLRRLDFAKFWTFDTSTTLGRLFVGCSQVLAAGSA
ncbi:hypothetical protein, partial [Escherichia coli]|uniref:hypothetical protein n=1 Tax=Escherichia coli TaxID=562 RepID=UPI001AD949E0